MATDMSQYYDSATFSDVTIFFGGQQIKAYKLVLANSSLYFRIAFDGKFKQEASSDALNLQDDDPVAVRGLIAHIYDISSESSGYYRDHLLRNHAAVDIDTSYIRYLVDLHVTASKYLVASAEERAMEAFESALPAGQYNNSEIIKHIYVTHAEAATEFRRPLAAFFASVANHNSMMQDPAASRS
ncbi:hypothetical protein LTR85_002421 [Meristemomyces frigidus]|nr:hypothetical protein LTR85_002421 [Meristemomyces frigidus]